MSVKAIVFSRYGDLLARFLASAEQSQPGSSSSVIVGYDSIANPESFGTCEMIPMESSDDFRFCRAFNLCVAAASPHDIVFVHDDMEIIVPDWLTAINDLITDWPDGYGIINLLQSNQSSGDAADISAPVIPRKFIDVIGEMDERYVGYGYSDYDFCLQTWHAGLKIGRTQYPFVDHEGTVASRRKLNDDALDRQGKKNHGIFIEKWGASVVMNAETHINRKCVCP